MVFQDLGLWISLNQLFAGSRSVAITEAASWEQGLTLARLEKPDLVVCSGRGLGLSPGELVEKLESAEIHSQQILCVVEDEQVEDNQAPDSGLTLCQRDCLPGVLNACLDRYSSRSLGPRVELLGRFEDIRCGDSSRTSGFGNVLELGRHELLLEADQPLGVGDVFGLNFFVPRTAVTDFASISISCRVAQSRNEEKLLYVVEIVDLDAEAEETLGRFVSYQERVQET
jgi:hypothetical protein